MSLSHSDWADYTPIQFYSRIAVGYKRPAGDLSVWNCYGDYCVCSFPGLLLETPEYSVIIIIIMISNISGLTRPIDLKVRPDLTVPDMTAKIGSIGKQDHDDECE